MRSVAVLLLLFAGFVAGAQNIYPAKEWTVSTPQAENIIPDSLAAIDRDITTGKYGYVDALFVTRNGKVIYDKEYKHDYAKIYGEQAKTVNGLNYFGTNGHYNYYSSWWHPYYRRGDLHTLQSVTKTITSIIIGVAITNNEFPDINTPILNFFDTSKVQHIDARKKSVTIRHLLTMTAGFEWNENISYSDPRNDCMRMEASLDWIQFVIDKPMSEEPGTRFNYNSGASELLAYIFFKATGKDIEEYAVQHLFRPLGIANYFWKRTPSGYPDTEGGLFLREEDLARIWYLFLRKGNWNGKQVISGSWIAASVTPAISVAPNTEYGYKWWLYGYNDGQVAWSGNGFGGQAPIVIPEYNIVVVVTAWNINTGKGLGHREIIRRILASVKK